MGGGGGGRAMCFLIERNSISWFASISEGFYIVNLKSNRFAKVYIQFPGEGIN